MLFVHFFIVMPYTPSTPTTTAPPGTPPRPPTSGDKSDNLRDLLIECQERLAPCEKESTKPTQKPKFDRVVVTASNENPFYSFFAPFMCWAWKHRLGVQPVIFFSRGIHPLTVNATIWAGGIPVIVDNLWPSTGKQMQNIRTLAAAHLELFGDDDTLITTADVDTIPLNATYFSLPPLDIARNQLIVHGNHKQTLPTMYPLPYLTMTAKVWRDVMGLNGLNLNEAVARMGIEFSPQLNDMYLDQLHVFNKVQVYLKQHKEFSVHLNEWWDDWRLDFRLYADANFHTAHPLVDAPGLRPGFVSRNWPRWVEGILRHIMDADTLAYFQKFRDEFVKQVMKGDDVAKGLKDGFNREG